MGNVAQNSFPTAMHVDDDRAPSLASSTSQINDVMVSSTQSSSSSFEFAASNSIMSTVDSQSSGISTRQSSIHTGPPSSDSSGSESGSIFRSETSEQLHLTAAGSSLDPGIQPSSSLDSNSVYSSDSACGGSDEYESSSSGDLVSQSDSAQSDFFVTPRTRETAVKDITLLKHIPAAYEIVAKLPTPHKYDDDGTFSSRLPQEMLQQIEKNPGFWLRGPFSPTCNSASSSVSCLAAAVESFTLSSDTSSTFSTQYSESFPNMPGIRMPLTAVGSHQMAATATIPAQSQPLPTEGVIAKAAPIYLSPTVFDAQDTYPTRPTATSASSPSCKTVEEPAGLSASIHAPKPEPASLRTYADATNLAKQYPDLAPLILSRPLSDTIDARTKSPAIQHCNPTGSKLLSTSSPSVAYTTTADENDPLATPAPRLFSAGSAMKPRKRGASSAAIYAANDYWNHDRSTRNGNGVEHRGNAARPVMNGRGKTGNSKRKNQRNLPKRPVFMPIENDQDYDLVDENTAPAIGRRAALDNPSEDPPAHQISRSSLQADHEAKRLPHGPVPESSQRKSVRRSRFCDDEEVEMEKNGFAVLSANWRDPDCIAARTFSSSDARNLSMVNLQMDNLDINSHFLPRHPEQQQGEKDHTEKQGSTAPATATSDSGLSSRITNLRVYNSSRLQDSMHAPTPTVTTANINKNNDRDRDATNNVPAFGRTRPGRANSFAAQQKRQLGGRNSVISGTYAAHNGSTATRETAETQRIVEEYLTRMAADEGVDASATASSSITDGRISQASEHAYGSGRVSERGNTSTAGLGYPWVHRP